MLRSVSGSNSSRGIAAVVGVGPRLGSAVARKFASEGYTIAILSHDLGTSIYPLAPPSSHASLPSSLFRSEKLSPCAVRVRAEKLSQLAEEIAQEAKAQVFALRVDCALSLGPIKLLVYNACEPWQANDDDVVDARPTPFVAVTPDAFHRALAVFAGGAFHCSQQVRYGTPHGHCTTHGESSRDWRLI